MKNIELQIYSLSKAATLMGIGKETLYQLIDQGRIGFIAFGKRKHIPYSEIIKFIHSNTVYNTTSTDTLAWSEDKSSTKASIEFDCDLIFDQIKGKYCNG